MPVIDGEGSTKARKRLLDQMSKNYEIPDKLPIAFDAAFDDQGNELVSKCLPNTRINLLREIDEWASSDNGTCIFWLGGMAGTGKSTVFGTVVQRFQDQHRLSVSFCFRRGEADCGNASRLITAIAFQLANRLPEVRARIIVAIKEVSGVIRKSLTEQFEKLILQPLYHAAAHPAHGPAWIIGIHALDECDEESDIGVILGLLARLKPTAASPLRRSQVITPSPVLTEIHSRSAATASTLTRFAGSAVLRIRSLSTRLLL